MMPRGAGGTVYPKRRVRLSGRGGHISSNDLAVTWTAWADSSFRIHCTRVSYFNLVVAPAAGPFTSRKISGLGSVECFNLISNSCQEEAIDDTCRLYLAFTCSHSLLMVGQKVALADGIGRESMSRSLF
ncbi:hypothetical protein Y032_0006g3068 [Ancylostoma ceylanicum]|uniref:Uncharacterized protein n=1 Tax=Ancylostoma ceylanicum TaxID=53326 RepID=A0A016VQM7_9BILA|nr:hypothetical protein Y032_0006g3068 [Ancylostoma ceylanicum]